MPGNKKPRKAYQPKPKLLPLGVKHGLKTELPLHLAWEALGTGDLDLHHVEEFMVHAEVLRYASPLLDMRNKGVLLHTFCGAILKRYRDAGRFGVSGPEMESIKAILTETIPYVRRLPNAGILRAVTRRGS